MAKLRVHGITISVDGFGAGPSQSLENPLGVGGLALHVWMFPTRTFRRMHGEGGGATGSNSSIADVSESVRQQRVSPINHEGVHHG